MEIIVLQRGNGVFIFVNCDTQKQVEQMYPDGHTQPRFPSDAHVPDLSNSPGTVYRAFKSDSLYIWHVQLPTNFFRDSGCWINKS